MQNLVITLSSSNCDSSILHSSSNTTFQLDSSVIGTYCSGFNADSCEFKLEKDFPASAEELLAFLQLIYHYSDPAANSSPNLDKISTIQLSLLAHFFQCDLILSLLDKKLVQNFSSAIADHNKSFQSFQFLLDCILLAQSFQFKELMQATVQYTVNNWPDFSQKPLFLQIAKELSTETLKLLTFAA
jgi:hypothetical protein